MHMIFILESSKGDDESHGVDAAVRPSHSLLSSSDPVPAHYIKVGDLIQSITGPRLVTNITTVQRHGLYNPITTDGTIVVDGIIASTYSSYTGTSHMEIPSFIDHSSSKEPSHHLLSKQNHHSSFLSISFHTIASMAYTPYRTYCTGSLTPSSLPSLLSSMMTTTDTKNEQRRCNSHDELANVNKMMKSIYTHTWENGSLSLISGSKTTQKSQDENKYNDFITVMKKTIFLITYLLIFGSIHFVIKYYLGIMLFITTFLNILNMFYRCNEKKTSMMKLNNASINKKKTSMNE